MPNIDISIISGNTSASAGFPNRDWALVANDSASIHLAEAMGTPTVYFAQREKLIHSHPAGDRCLALYDEEENRPSRIPVRRALAVVREMLGG